MRNLVLVTITLLLTIGATAQVDLSAIPRFEVVDCDELRKRTKMNDHTTPVRASIELTFECDLEARPDVLAEAGQRIVFRNGFEAPKGTKLHARIRQGLKPTEKLDEVLEETTVNGDVSVYPNPTRGEVYVTLPETTEALTMQLYNMVGQAVITENNVNGSLVRFNLEGMPQGVYFLRVSGGGHDSVTKLVLQ